MRTVSIGIDGIIGDVVKPGITGTLVAVVATGAGTGFVLYLAMGSTSTTEPVTVGTGTVRRNIAAMIYCGTSEGIPTLIPGLKIPFSAETTLVVGGGNGVFQLVFEVSS